MKVQWVRYKNMAGGRYRGQFPYKMPIPGTDWDRILGVVARCEGKFDTVVSYDNTFTFGAFQWTFNSGRLQKMLQSFKAIPYLDFETDTEKTLFEAVCEDKKGRQIFRRFGFEIHGGKFVAVPGGVLNPAKKIQRQAIVDICMGRRSLDDPKKQKQFALALCKVFAELGQLPEVQAAQVEYGKMEFKKALDVRRKPLKSVGGTIRDLLPEGTWGTPIPAIFFNLCQNAPAGSFMLFKNAMKTAVNKGLVEMTDSGYEMSPGSLLEDLLDIIWRRLCKTKYADWGFGSRQYIESGGKNPPRIKRIKRAIKEFYDTNLPFYK